MSHEWHLIIKTIAHTGLSLLITYITWLVVRGQWMRDTSQKEAHHD